jgi:hypothetical protein
VALGWPEHTRSWRRRVCPRSCTRRRLLVSVVEAPYPPSSWREEGDVGVGVGELPRGGGEDAGARGEQAVVGSPGSPGSGRVSPPRVSTSAPGVEAIWASCCRSRVSCGFPSGHSGRRFFRVRLRGPCSVPAGQRRSPPGEGTIGVSASVTFVPCERGIAAAVAAWDAHWSLRGYLSRCWPERVPRPVVAQWESLTARPLARGRRRIGRGLSRRPASPADRARDRQTAMR